MTTVYRTPGEVEKCVEKIELPKKEKTPKPPNPLPWFVLAVLAGEAIIAYAMGLTTSVFVYLGLADTAALCLVKGIIYAQDAASMRDKEREENRRFGAFTRGALWKAVRHDHDKLEELLLEAHKEQLSPKDAKRIVQWLRTKE